MKNYWKTGLLKLGIMATELQSNRVTELQTPKGTQYTGG